MTHRLFLGLCGALSAACGAGSVIDGSATTDAGRADDGGVVGAPCVPLEEGDASFVGFSESDVSVESKHPQCPGAVCLLNHFRGRTSCPYGQSSTCTSATPAQCVDRRAASTVLCSCRCANAAGKTDDGATYCSCPSNLVCSQLIASIGGPNDTFSGGYCVPPGTDYVEGSACTSECDPQTNSCP